MIKRKGFQTKSRTGNKLMQYSIKNNAVSLIRLDNGLYEVGVFIDNTNYSKAFNSKKNAVAYYKNAKDVIKSISKMRRY